jgi:pimeloyl-ACP methyl ester carboxylesterase
VAQVSLQGYVESLCDLIETIGQPVVLVGHSMGGIVISQLAQQRPERIERLVYLTAMLPRSGQSLVDNVLERREVELAQPADGGLSLSLSESSLAEFFYHDCLQQLPWAKARLVPQALAPFVTPVALSDDRFGRLPRSYIHCRADRVVEFGNQRRMVRATPCDSTVVLDCGHMAMLADPQGVADALRRMLG